MAANIEIIQGDYKHIRVDFASSTYAVESFKFSSSKLGINKHFTEQEDGKWYITLESNETANLPECVATFDITVMTTNGKPITGLYHGTVIVKAKDNSCED